MELVKCYLRVYYVPGPGQGVGVQPQTKPNLMAGL